MTSTSGPLSQKEYLKKYLSKPKKKKKKKEKISSSTFLKRSQIIDDDLGLGGLASIDDEEFNLDHLGDEAPQIAGVVDERPPEVRAREEYGDTKKWKDLGEDSADKEASDIYRNKSNQILASSKNSDSDFSPERNVGGDRLEKKGKEKNERYNDIPVKRKAQLDSDSDVSPPRRKSFKDMASGRKSGRDSKDEKLRRPRNSKYDSDSDASPPRMKSHKDRISERKNGRDSYDDTSKKQKEYNYDSDISPPRNSKLSSEGKRDLKLKRSKEDCDLFSNPKKGNGLDQRKDIKKERNKYSDSGSDSDISVPRRSSSKHDNNKFSSKSLKNSGRGRDSRSPLPSKMKKSGNEAQLKDSKSRRYKSSDDDLSPPRRRDENQKQYLSHSSKSKYRSGSRERKQRSESPDLKRTKKMEKTLDGKRAGLQKASNLTEELDALKRDEEKMYLQMSKSLSGKGAAPILRDRKTGRIRDLAQEKLEAKEKAAKTAKRDEKYYKWGKGLKQVEDSERRISDAIHEMSKPLARYANDEDLDNYLKAQEREGDPMLEYFRKKQAESIDCANPAKPKYKGSFLPNRFGVPPGHRWDGVDRSNGYEKQWFEARNAKKAVEEEAYKWSTSDM